MVIPPSPGVLCALGDATTTLRHEVGVPFIGKLGKTKATDFIDACWELLHQGTKVAKEEQGLIESQTVGYISG